MTPKRKLVYTEVLRIRWGDMDAAGHVNNTVYFRYAEQARIGWLDALGLRGGPVGPVVINASFTFLKQLAYPGDVEVRVFLGAIGRSSFETWYEMRPSYDREVIYAEGAAKVVWIDYARSKSTALPDSIRSLS